jgi:hypothetical protein
MYTHLLSLLTEMCNECIDLDIDIVHKHPIVDYFSVLYMEKTMEYYYENVEEPKTLIRDEYDNIAYGISVHEMAQEIKLNRFITCNDMRYFYLSKIMKEEKNK